MSLRQSNLSAPVFDPDATNASNEPLYELVFARYVPPAQQVTIGASVSGRPSNGQVILIPITRALRLTADAAGSQASAGVAARAEADVTVAKNGASIGTVRFAAAGTTGSFVGVATTNFVAGDRLSLVFPATSDMTLADIGIALQFTGN